MSAESIAVLRSGLTLPEDERARVAAELFASLEGPDGDYSPDAAQDWAREVERRINRFAAGESVGVDLATVRERVHTKLDSR